MKIMGVGEEIKKKEDEEKGVKRCEVWGLQVYKTTLCIEV
jgi:hypothetical protein